MLENGSDLFRVRLGGLVCRPQKLRSRKVSVLASFTARRATRFDTDTIPNPLCLTQAYPMGCNHPPSASLLNAVFSPAVHTNPSSALRPAKSTATNQDTPNSVSSSAFPVCQPHRHTAITPFQPTNQPIHTIPPFLSLYSACSLHLYLVPAVRFGFAQSNFKGF
jgi:hypothetical protein